MGASGSKKLVGRLTGFVRPIFHDDKSVESHYAADPREVGIDCTSYLVTTRRSSKYLDEEGFVAHEFWEVNVNRQASEPALKRTVCNLRPQGEIPYENPRLTEQYPFVLTESNKEIIQNNSIRSRDFLSE